MTLAERILNVFRGEKPDVIPWFADLTYWYAASVKRGSLPERYLGDGVVDLYRDLGCGCHEHALSNPWLTEYDDVVETTRYEDDSAGEHVQEETEWTTPVGTLTQVKRYEPGSFCWAYRKYPITSLEDLRTYRFIAEHSHYTPDYSVPTRQLALWGDLGVPAAVPPRSPMANLIVIWMGVVNLSYALADAPAEIERTLEVVGNSEDSIYEIIERGPTPLVYFGENITGDMVSPRLFNKYYAPYYRRRMPGLRAAGKHVFVHVDGTFRSLLPHIAASGVDCAQSLTVAPVGDVELGDMRSLAGPELILWSGIPGAMFSPLYSDEMVREMTIALLKRYRNDGRFIMGVCDQVPPDGVIERIRMITDLVEEHGRPDA